MESRNKTHNPDNYESTLIAALRHDRTSFFSLLAKDTTHLVSSHYDFDITSEIGIALQHAADGRQNHIDALIKMLKRNPLLLLQRGRVITPGGHDVRAITIYEYCLASGDTDLASIIQPCFTYLKNINGHAEEEAQYSRYEAHINSIPEQEPYDIKCLIDLVKNASNEDITALLENDMSHPSILRDALLEFRKFHAPEIITEPRMLINYMSLQKALEQVNAEFHELFMSSDCNLNKINFIWRQLIGFQQRRLPGIDRCRLAQGLKHPTWKRTYDYVDDSGELQTTISDCHLDGLGTDYALNIVYGKNSKDWNSDAIDAISKYITNKYNELKQLKPQPPIIKSTRISPIFL